MCFINHLTVTMTLLLAVAAPSVLSVPLVNTDLELTNNATNNSTSDVYRTGSMSMQIAGYNFTDVTNCSDRILASLYGQFRFMAPKANETHTINIQQNHISNYERRDMVFRLVGHEVNRDQTQEPDLIADFSGHVDYNYRVANETVALDNSTQVLNTTTVAY